MQVCCAYRLETVASSRSSLLQLAVVLLEVSYCCGVGAFMRIGPTGICLGHTRHVTQLPTVGTVTVVGAQICAQLHCATHSHVPPVANLSNRKLQALLSSRLCNDADNATVPPHTVTATG